MRSCLICAMMLFGNNIAASQKDDQDVYTILGPERSLAEIEAIAAKMKPVVYVASPERWSRLTRTSGILASRERPLRVLMLGDSIVNDTSRSSWELLVERAYPGCKVAKTTVVRGSTGCWWYREPDRLERYVISQKPDLLIIGGISQKDDLDSIRVVAETARRDTGCDVLLMTPAFGSVDPRDDGQWSPEPAPDRADYRGKLARLAEEMQVAFLDMTGAWGRYVRESGETVESFKRDVVHANERGEQILGRVLAAYLAPAGT